MRQRPAGLCNTWRSNRSPGGPGATARDPFRGHAGLPQRWLSGYIQGVKRPAAIFVILCVLTALPAWANTLIERAWEAGVLDLETALLYQYYAVRDPGALPVEYRETAPHPFCGTPAIVAVRQARRHMSREVRAKLAKAMQRPALGHSYVAPSGNFRIHYEIGDRSGAVDSTDLDGNDVPDYVDAVAATLDSVWRLQVEVLGYAPPPSDGGIDGEEYDIYIRELGAERVYGYAHPEQDGPTTHSYLEIDNNFTDPIYTQSRGLDALRVAVAHEFFHAVQFGYYQGWEGIWWQEVSATWMEDVAYPEVDDYLQYLSFFMQRPWQSFEINNRISSTLYGAAIFAHFLDQRYERALIRSIWEELGRAHNARLDKFDKVIRQHDPGGLREVVSEFAAWNYFTGDRHQEGRFYAEGHKYPEVASFPLQPEAGAVAQDSGRVDHLGSAYIRLDPQLRPGGLSLEMLTEQGLWSRQLILISPDEARILPLNGNAIQVADWDQYEEIALVLTVTEPRGRGYEYSVAAEYDPNLTGEGAIPLALRLGRNYPNPFRPGLHARTIIPFDLDRASTATRLSIFSVDGRLIRSYDLGGRAPRSFADAGWDGRNEAGKLVASGIYYYVLEADGNRLARVMALIAD